MPDSDLKVGVLIRHDAKPEWGLGKVVHVDDRHVHVYFTEIEAAPQDVVLRLSRGVGMLTRAEVQSHAMLDHLPPLKAGKVPPRHRVRLTERQAIAEFTASYSSFEIDGYERAERHYAWQAHLLIAEWFTSDEGRQLLTAGASEALAHKMCNLLGLTSLLTTHERQAFNDAFADLDAASRYATAVLAFVNSPSEITFNRLVNVIGDVASDMGAAHLLTWPAVTTLPYLAKPDELPLLKPDVTRRVADAFCFDLQCDAHPTWTTYRRLQRLSEHLLTRLRSLGARDFIDVHAFLGVVSASPAMKGKPARRAEG